MEPVNVITNIFFIVAGLMAIKKMKILGNLKPQNFDIILLSIIMMSIGIGSAFYHFKPNALTLNLDVLPIALFIHIFLISVLLRVFKTSILNTLVLFILFVGAGVASEIYFDRGILNGTIMYIPTYITLLLILLALKRNKDWEYDSLLVTTFIWTASLIFRTIDAEACVQTHGIGTHAIWHILNAVVLYRLVSILIRRS